MKSRREWLAIAALAGVAAYFLSQQVVLSRLRGIRAYDIYSYSTPMALYFVHSLRDHGRGLLWNPYQNCGQPFLGSGTTGVLYPPTVLFFVLDSDHALLGVLVFNLVVGGIGTYLLARELGLHPLAALCGGLAFLLSNASVDIITWTPLLSGAYAWVPAAMLFCERILRQPTLARGVALGAVLAVSLLAGHPQPVFYLYQLIALRLLWELLTRPRALQLRTLATLGLGLGLAPLLIAVDLLPALEMTAASVRNAALSVKELAPGGFFTWKGLRIKLAWRSQIHNPFLLLPCVLGALALVRTPTRRLAAFYLIAGAISLDLALGLNGYLFAWYARLPLGTLFRDPDRFLWITGFCFAVLVAFGVDAIATDDGRSRGPVYRVALVALSALALVGFLYLSPTGLYPREWQVAGITLAACVMAALVSRAHTLAAGAITVALAFSLLFVGPPPFRRLVPDGDRLLFEHARFFADLRARMTPQDRIYLVPKHEDYSLQQKTGSLFGVPSLFDYEAQPTKRYAQFYQLLRTGKMMASLNDWMYPVEGFLDPGLNRRLLDLTGARYFVLHQSANPIRLPRNPPLRLVASSEGINVFESSTALPRAQFVPRAEVLTESAVLERLASGEDDFRDVVLLEEDPPDGFRGDRMTGPAPRVDFVTNDPERVTLRVDAPQRGFLFLADQYFPGWQATVNDAPAPILRANYAFRAVPVPRGLSRVDFRYRPPRVRVGALISATTILVVGVALVRARSKPRA